MNNRKRKRALQHDRLVAIVATTATSPESIYDQVVDDIRKGVNALEEMPITIARMEANVIKAEALDTGNDPVKTAKIKHGREQVEIAKVRFAKSKAKYAELKAKIAAGLNKLKGQGVPNEQS